MTIDEIREIVAATDRLLFPKEYGKVLLAEIDRLTAEKERLESVIKAQRDWE